MTRFYLVQPEMSLPDLRVRILQRGLALIEGGGLAAAKLGA